MIKKIKKYLGKINFIYDAARETYGKLKQIEENFTEIKENIPTVKNYTSPPAISEQPPISSIKVLDEILYLGSTDDKVVFGAMQDTCQLWHTPDKLAGTRREAA